MGSSSMLILLGPTKQCSFCLVIQTFWQLLLHGWTSTWVSGHALLIDGLNGYWKTWLQFVFTVYTWIITAIIIVASHYSSMAAKIFGNKSVPVLATLFLLSYAKLLKFALWCDLFQSHKLIIFLYQMCTMLLQHIVLLSCNLHKAQMLWYPQKVPNHYLKLMDLLSELFTSSQQLLIEY